MARIIRFVASDKMVQILAALFFLEMGLFFVLAQDKTKILVLHSYTPGYSWSDDINRGIVRAFVNNEAVKSAYHYMATKDAGADQKRRAQKIAHRRIADFQPDIILAIDDNANALVAKDYVNDDAINIIFAGVNGSVTPYGYDGAPNVTGIYERKPVGALVELINILNRYDEKISSVLFLSDTSTSAKHDAEHMQAADWGGSVVFKKHIATDSFAEWKDIVLNLPDDVDYLLIGGYRRLKRADDSGTPVSPEEVAQWTVRHSKKLVVGLNAFNSQDGVPLSVGVSPYEQGEVAAGLALTMIKTGQPAGDFDYVNPTQYFVSMNADAIDGSPLYQNIPNLLEAFARSTRNYFQQL